MTVSILNHINLIACMYLINEKYNDYHGNLQSVNEYVDREDEKYDRKKRMLNKNWNEHVFDVVQVMFPLLHTNETIYSFQTDECCVQFGIVFNLTVNEVIVNFHLFNILLGRSVLTM